MNDLEAAGYCFEALVVRDLRIYAQRFGGRVDTGEQGQPDALIVITATGSAGRRSDGVHVAPITALAP